MNNAVLDASAILAILFAERGSENIPEEILNGAVVSAVNLAEVQTKLVKMGRAPEDAWIDALSLGIGIESYTSEHAKTAGSLISKSEKYGLSLGDRSCLALAIALNGPVYTTEQAWKNLKAGIPIHVIR